jgi:DNA-binding SARP family transcriptional activator
VAGLRFHHTRHLGEGMVNELGEGNGVKGLKLRLLNGFEMERDGLILPDSVWGRRAARTLLKLLAIQPTRRLHRDQVLDVIWPNTHPEVANNHLHNVLSAARHALQPDLQPKGKSSYVRLSNGVVSLLGEELWVDVWYFEHVATEALRSKDPAIYETALAAYAGELLPEDRYEDWTTERREELADLYLRLLLQAANLDEQRGEFGAAIERLRRAARLDPVREDAHRELMRVYVKAGSPHLAVRQYQACVRALAQELEVKPDTETTALYEQIVDAGPSNYSVPARGTTLPAPTMRLHRQSAPLIGREGALRRLRGDMNRASEGKGGTTVISGEAGIGKSRLLAELAAWALGEGWTVLWGASHEEEGVLPYGAWIEAVDTFLAGQNSGFRNRLHGVYPEIARLLPSLRSSETDMLPATSEMERSQLFAAAVSLMTEISASRPLLLVSDDLHAADPATVQLFHHLAWTAPQRGWLIVGAYREEEMARQGEVRRVLTSLARAGLYAHIELTRLTLAELDRLIGSLLDGESIDPQLVAAVHALSLGNPLFAQELIRATQDVGRLEIIAGQWQNVGDPPVPRQVRDLVAARVDRMGTQVQQTLELAATAGGTFTFELIAASAAVFRRSLSHSAVLDALDRALEVGILEEGEEGYAFRHPLFRLAIYQQLSRSRRAHLHGVLASTLETEQPEQVESLAHHYTRSTNRGKALVYLERAGDRARGSYANDIAASFYTDLLHRLEVHAPREQRARVCEKLGDTLAALARFGEALDQLEAAASAYQIAGDGVGEVRVTASIGLLHFQRGTSEGGIKRIAPLLPRLEHETSFGGLARLTLVMAELLFGVGRFGEQAAMAERAASLARRDGDAELVAEAEVQRGAALNFLGRRADAVRVAEEAVVRAEETGQLKIIQRALKLLAAIEDDRGNMQRSYSLRMRALFLAEQVRDPVAIAVLLSHIGGTLFWLGRYGEAREKYVRSIGLFETLDVSRSAAYPHGGLGRICLAEGDLEAASIHFERARVLAHDTNNLEAQALVEWALAATELEHGHPTAARARLLELQHRLGSDNSLMTVCLPLLAEAHVASGELSEAESVARLAVERARAEDSVFHLIFAQRATGILLAAHGRWDAAGSALLDSAERARSAKLPEPEGRAWHELGVVHWMQGDLRQAQDRLDSAAAIFTQINASWWLDKTHRALQTLIQADLSAAKP